MTINGNFLPLLVQYLLIRRFKQDFDDTDTARRGFYTPPALRCWTMSAAEETYYIFGNLLHFWHFFLFFFWPQTLLRLWLFLIFSDSNRSPQSSQWNSFEGPAFRGHDSLECWFAFDCDVKNAPQSFGQGTFFLFFNSCVVFWFLGIFSNFWIIKMNNFDFSIRN